MGHLAVALFFTAMLLAAAVAIHMTLRMYWTEFVLALRGELGLEIRRPARRARAPRSAAPRPAAF